MADIERNPQRKDVGGKQKQNNEQKLNTPGQKGEQKLNTPGQQSEQQLGQRGEQEAGVNQRLADNDEGAESDENLADDEAQARDDGSQDTPDTGRKNRS